MLIAVVHYTKVGSQSSFSAAVVSGVISWRRVRGSCCVAPRNRVRVWILYTHRTDQIPIDGMYMIYVLSADRSLVYY